MGIVRERADHHQNTPENFAIVETGIYRCSFPNSSNFPFIETLNLKSILCLCPEPYPEENTKFLQSKNVKLFQFGLQGTKKESVSDDTITEAVKVLLDVRNHPILIHCKHGKHRTGCVVGCYRKVKNWCLSCVLKEYQRFAGEKARPSDMNFIENYDTSSCLGQRFYSGISYGKQCLVYQEEMANNNALAAATAGGANIGLMWGVSG
ncbi:hypothetical protein C5167_046434 [Papaver somniferum]|uniref:diphosphoinositol-polyphosphate diphosphatase n=1 Tax=Papaver somniferum TaxID=3469 RepID=A0A4Y7LH93_PAPSO|nr:tyrosine-protein phosphatase DSP3-like [Papaver somniferum]RZC83641.1 hypothetical protein C5167_046434 [Papaver somniferum]